MVEDDNGLGVRVRQLRNEADLSLRALGERISVSKSYLADIENGRANPSLPVAESIADFFGVSVDYLLGRNGDDEPDLEDLPVERVAAHVKGELEEVDPDMADFVAKKIHEIRERHRRRMQEKGDDGSEAEGGSDS